MSDLSWFDEEWIEKEKQVDKHILAGEYEEFETLEEMFDALTHLPDRNEYSRAEEKGEKK